MKLKMEKVSYLMNGAGWPLIDVVSRVGLCGSQRQRFKSVRQ